MDLERLFDIVCHTKDPDTRGTNYKFNDKVILTPAQQGTVIQKSIQAFVHGVATPSGAAKIQAFSGSSDLPQLTKDVFNVTMAAPSYDLNWQQVFKGVPLKKGQLSWEIGGVSVGAIFKLIPEGGKVEFESIEGEKITVDINKYGAGLGITWEITEGRKLYKFVELMDAMRGKLYGIWADTHYGLLATAGALNAVSWVAGTTTLERDIATLNSGALALATANKDKGYGDTANMPFVLYAGPALKARINQALKATSDALVNSGKALSVPVDYNISPFYSNNSAIESNKALLVLPGNKIQNSIYLRELGLSETEIASLNELRTYWTAFGAAVGDTDQVYELAFA